MTDVDIGIGDDFDSKLKYGYSWSLVIGGKSFSLLFCCSYDFLYIKLYNFKSMKTE